MAAWSSGRVALVGDAGYCASPLSGMGTSLALVGAYVLAGEVRVGHPRDRDGDEVHAALAVPADRGAEMVHHRRGDRPP